MLRYALSDLWRNPRRTLASLAGITLAVALMAALVVFADTSSSEMTSHAVAPVTLDLQAGVNAPLASALTLSETSRPPAPLAAGQRVTVVITVTSTGARLATAVSLQDSIPAQLAYQAESTRRAGQLVPDPPAGAAPSAGAGGGS